MKRGASYTVIAVILVLCASLLVLPACKGDGNSSGSSAGSSGDKPAFNVKGAAQLISLSNTVTSGAKKPSGVLQALAGKPSLLSLQVVNQGLSSDEVNARLDGKASVSQAPINQVLQGTNLISVDANGNASLAISSNYLVKVMYSVTDPQGQYVYLALDPGLTPDGNDYTPFIAQNNCAFYKVSISNNSFSCVMEGIYINGSVSTYASIIGNNVKPIQFDGTDNVYFPAAPFSRTCNTDGRCTLQISRNAPRIYRATPAGTVSALTQDNQSVQYYIVMTTGQIAYQASSTAGSSLYVWQPSGSPLTPNGTTINLTGGSGGGAFAIDDFNTIMWTASNGIRFARPLPTSGVEKATLNTSIFSSSGSVVTPLKMIVADNGKIYGVFSDSKSVQDAITKQYTYYTIYRLYEILPANASPAYEVTFVSSPAPFTPIRPTGSTPFMVSRDFLFFKETKEKLGYGTYDVIKMVNLNDKSVTTLLDNTGTWYEIYSWNLRGNKLYFSALDLARTVVISGEIDVKLVQDQPNRPQTDYFSYRDVASALGASSRVQDIEGLTSLPVLAVTDPPAVNTFYTDVDNIYSASVAFNKLMNKSSVESSLTFTDSTSNIVTMKIWNKNYLHLIPDLDKNGTTAADDPLLDLANTTPLSFDTSYTVGLGSGAKDLGGAALSPALQTFTTRPESGWYIAFGNLGKYAGLQRDPLTHQTVNSYEYYAMNVFKSVGSSTSNLPRDFRFQFRARNKGTGGLGILVYDASPASTFIWPPYNYPGTSIYSRFVVNANLSRNSGNLLFQQAYCGSRDISGNCTFWYIQNGYAYSVYSDISWQSIFTGDWMHYRMDLYGNNLSFSYSKDGLSFNPILFSMWDYNLGSNVSTSAFTTLWTRNTISNTYQLYLKMTAPMDIDEMQVVEITGTDGAGNPILGSTLMSENFARFSLLSAPALDGTVKNSPILTHVTTTVPSDPYGVLTQQYN